MMPKLNSMPPAVHGPRIAMSRNFITWFAKRKSRPVFLSVAVQIFPPTCGSIITRIASFSSVTVRHFAGEPS